MKSTKQNILESALKLFNQNGFVNVRLQHIADEAFISVGNLAYHFPNKEAILIAVYDELTGQQKELLAEYRVVPLFDNLDRLIRRTYQLQQLYVFFYLDTLEIVRAYPSVKTAHQQHIASQISQLKTILDFNAARGALIAEPMEDVFDHLASQIWMTMDFWLAQQSVKSDDTTKEKDYQRAVWNLLIPYFTDMGKREYEQMLQMPYDFFF
ncbi:MAG: TetR/AcrR family transcriptional regulator [Saprospiraceae bacterium]